ncbi:MAG: discoidin domain-containing protein [Bacteroidales bacterium]|nr:discoidin domain-containing protein [Bacteroidales bacterium]
MNLAWISFSYDLTSLNTTEFTKALDQISNGGGNVMRWWLHTNGTNSPKFAGDSVSAPATNELANLKKGLDLAYARGMGLVMCLWSFDMLRANLGSTILNRNLLLLQDSVKLQAYINNDLIPMLQAVGDHPAVICWEVFNEPEGMSNEFGWSDIAHVPMSQIQRFVNRVAGTVHREVPTAKVSNGCWSFYAGSDQGSNINYYSDDRLIAAGGDAQGTLDFYMVHYYDWGGTSISPFHHPASYWELDKPLVIGEFSAHGPYTGIDPKTAYNYLYQNGYAGGLSWTWTGHDGNGNVTDASEGMLDLYYSHPLDIVIDYPDTTVNYIPRPIKSLADTAFPKSSASLENFLDLKEYFRDVEDSTALIFSIVQNTNPTAVSAVLSAEGIMNLTLKNLEGLARITIKAADHGGRYANGSFIVSVFDTASENKAFLRRAYASSTFRPAYPAFNAVDGSIATEWISKDSVGQWIAVQLDKEYTIDGISLIWGANYARNFDIQTSGNGTDWTTRFNEPNGKGDTTFSDIGNIDASFIRIIANTKKMSGGVSLLEFEVYKNGFFSGIYSFEYEDESIEVFPVPAHDEINIAMTDETAIEKISLLNGAGQLIHNFTFSPSTKTIDISKLMTGNYYMFIYTDGKAILKKFVKQ